MSNIINGDRVQNTYGFAGTVLKVFDDEGIALVRFDDEKRGAAYGRDWHAKIENLTKI